MHDIKSENLLSLKSADRAPTSRQMENLELQIDRQLSKINNHHKTVTYQNASSKQSETDSEVQIMDKISGNSIKAKLHSDSAEFYP